MPGYELYDDIERKELMDVIQSGIFMRYGLTEPEEVIGRRKSWRPPFVSALELLMHSLPPAVPQPCTPRLQLWVSAQEMK